MGTYWKEEQEKYNKFESVNKNMKTEIAIIGGGLVGLQTAYYLCKNHKNVVVLEKDRICSHTSGANTGKVTSQHGIFYKYLVNSKGDEFAKKYLEANEEAILDIKKIIEQENIECEFKKENAYVFTQKEDQVQKLKDEVEIVNKLGKKAEFKEGYQDSKISILGMVKFENQAQFHPVKYAYGLCKSIIKNNGEIFENSKVIDFKKEDGEFVLQLEGYQVKAKSVVIATRYPIINVPGYHFLKMYQSTSYALVVDIKEEFPDGMFISSETPTISCRKVEENNKELLEVVGYDYKTGEKQMQNGYEELEKIIKTMYPKSEIKYKWVAEDTISLDKIPYIGEFSNIMPNAYVATGFNKWGITSSNIASKIISDKIIGKENKYEEIFKSTRIEPVKNIKELSNMVKQATNSIVLSKFKIPKEHLENVQIGEGKIIEVEGSKVGVYKVTNDEIYAVNPVCTHLGCELSFNNIEKTWDCPCHGSRFSVEGKSIETPSINDLKTKANEV